jgi:hypothetical protein
MPLFNSWYRILCNSILPQRLSVEQNCAPNQWKTRKALSIKFIDDVRMRLQSQGVAHLDVTPVYLGYCSAYCDWSDFVATNDLHCHIVKAFRTMAPRDFDNHPLAHFFTPVTSQGDGVHTGGYVPKTYTNQNGNASVVFHVDHILPAY